MKKVLIAVLAVLLCFGAVLGFASCKEEETTKVKVDINLAAMTANMAYSTLSNIEKKSFRIRRKNNQSKRRFFSKNLFGRK